MGLEIDVSPYKPKVVSLAEFRRQPTNEDNLPPPPRPAAAAQRPFVPVPVDLICSTALGGLAAA
jgi:hypothetical protein